MRLAGEAGIQKLAFSTDALPDGLDDRARFGAWRDFFGGLHGSFDLDCHRDLPFVARFEALPVGQVAAARFFGTMSRIGRSRSQVAADANDHFFLAVNTGQAAIGVAHTGRAADMGPGAMVLMTNGQPGEVRLKPGAAYRTLALPRASLREAVAEAEDLLVRPVDPLSPASRHLRRYLEMLLDAPPEDRDPLLGQHIGATLLDLVALALGASREAAQMARLRGRRAARLQEVLAVLREGFAEPGFSPERAGARLGLSARYVQALLQETGSSFTERVLELRLQKARELLADPRANRLRVIDIALACGFGEVSHFNRCFRRRFGGAPNELRRARLDA